MIFLLLGFGLVCIVVALLKASGRQGLGDDDTSGDPKTAAAERETQRQDAGPVSSTAAGPYHHDVHDKDGIDDGSDEEGGVAARDDGDPDSSSDADSGPSSPD